MRDNREEEMVGVGAGDGERSSSEGRDVGMRFARLESAFFTSSPSNGIGAIAKASMPRKAMRRFRYAALALYGDAVVILWCADDVMLFHPAADLVYRGGSEL
jgi:hypothetical protein